VKEGYRFVDCDMHIMEPIDLFDKYLDSAFKTRVTSAMRPTDSGSTGMRRRPLWFFDGTPTSNDGNVSQYNRTRGPLVSSRANQNVMFAVERGYDAEAQVMGMKMEGVDIAVLFPTAGLSFLGRDNMDPQLSAAICRAYNDWLHDFTQYSADQLKMAAMLPIHDVNLACRELHRCVRDYGAVGAFVRPNYVNAAIGIRPIGIRCTACCRTSMCRSASMKGRDRIIRRSSPALARTGSCATWRATLPRCSSR